MVDRELSFTKSLGFNAVRAWLHEKAYKEDPDKYLANMDDFLKIHGHPEYGTRIVWVEA